MLQITLHLFIALAAAAPWGWGWGSGWNPDHSTVVFTDNGPILGHAAPNRSEVSEFLGIPYAEPPVGDLRFAAPVPYRGFGLYNASSFPVAGEFKYPDLTSQAQRILENFDDQAVDLQGEDCLTLNIWTKQSRGWVFGRRLAPVVVAFHGGRYVVGGTDTPFYYGQFWASAENVVVVTVSFRLGIFGFPGAPNQPAQNLGLRDQRAAVEWLRDNVEAFGGDPRKISILGQSAGSQAVDYWAYAYPEDPIVSGLISHSGNALSFAVDTTAAKDWYNVSASLGCGSEGDTVSCVRGKSWQDIEKYANKVQATKSNTPLRGNSPFTPVADGVIVFNDYIARANAGKFAKVPYLVGENNYEQGFYQLSAYQKGTNTTQPQADAFLLSTFTCTNSFAASTRRAHGVAAYEFRYFGDWENLRLYPTSGAYHGVDVDVLFGNDAQVSGIEPSQAEQQTTAWLQHAWAVFGADPWNGLSKQIGWPQFDENTNSLARIAYNNNPVPDYVKPTVYDSTCSTVTFAAVASPLS